VRALPVRGSRAAAFDVFRLLNTGGVFSLHPSETVTFLAFVAPGVALAMDKRGEAIFEGVGLTAVDPVRCEARLAHTAHSARI